MLCCREWTCVEAPSIEEQKEAQNIQTLSCVDNARYPNTEEGISEDGIAEEDKICPMRTSESLTSAAGIYVILCPCIV